MRKTQSKILIADDDTMVRSTVSKILEMFGHAVYAVEDGRDVLEIIDETFDVIILDINMPDMDGFQTITALNALDLDIPVLFLTGAGSMDYVVKAINLGAYDFLTKPIEDLDIFNVKIRRAIEKRMYVLQERRYKAELEDDIRLKAKELEEKNKLLLSYSRSLENATVQLMSSLQNAMEEKDFYTAGHTMRVTEYAAMLGRAMGFPEEELKILSRAAQFHDIGKLVIDLSCIQKPGKLTDEEWVLIKKHPSVGANIIGPLGFMEKEQFIIRHHHERVDGKGYPDGLNGDDLDSLTKILIVVDSYDAMTSKRNYRRNLSMEVAIEELFACSGTQFDLETVECFSKNIVNFTPDKSVFSSEYIDGVYAAKNKK
ncbi:HD domain-containing phosphohydrolase [Desulfosediminicola flagellatus]|uniref:HD domain-containing phosphohydrolase n=1 Tax=Desulfosediminicola flagellatus TaxID=2569541 RepID=UPI0010AC7877|nr:HD domain-containing phosphohydrolase [Desulfosediminicola flagellatus]